MRMREDKNSSVAERVDRARRRVMRLYGVAIFLFLPLSTAILSARDADAVRWPDATRRVEIRGEALDSDIIVSASSRTAGAIDSLVWRGKEFINTIDHGRELQSASSFNGLGECFNPTEAGSARDSAGEESTSVLLSLSAQGRQLRTRSQMAFWLEEGESSIHCGAGSSIPRRRTLHSLTKTVTIGALGVANAIEHTVTFVVPEAYDSGTFEALTAYTTPDLARFSTFDPSTGELRPLSDGPGEQALPVIFSTPDGDYAIGVYSPSLPQPEHPEAGYGRFNFGALRGRNNATMKWNCVFRKNSVRAGGHSFTCYTLVGTLRDVQDGMQRLHAARSGRALPPQRAAIATAAQPSAPTPEPTQGVELFVGVEPGCNAGVVTTDARFLNCRTRALGRTGADQTTGAGLYVGVTPNVNQGVVSTNPAHLGGATRHLGFPPRLSRERETLYVGVEPGCNAGVVTTSASHLGCVTEPIVIRRRRGESTDR